MLNPEEEQGEIYCKDCQYLKKEVDEDLYIYYVCKKSLITSSFSSPLEKISYQRYESINDKNKNNNCSDFKKREYFNLKKFLLNFLEIKI